MLAVSTLCSPLYVPWYSILIPRCPRITMSRRRNQDPQTPNPPSTSFPFLRLPVELRVQIYQYLIPDLPVPTWFSNYRRSPLRRDGAPCCPAILRTCRTIYRELVAEWYGAAMYSISIAYHGIYCFNSKFLPYSRSLPSVFREIKYLDLSIELTGYLHVCTPRSSDYGTSTYCPQFTFQDCLQVLVDCFAPGRAKLKQLRLHLSAGLPFFYYIKRHPGEVLRTLEWNLAPLRKIQGLSEVSIDLHIPKIVSRVDFRSQPLIHKIEAEFRTVGRELLDMVQREMSGDPVDTHIAFRKRHPVNPTGTVCKWNATR